MPNPADLLIDCLANRTARIGVVGLGYVGLPLALRFSAAGYATTGFDIDADKVACLSRGESYISHITDQRIAQARAKQFTATTDFAAAKYQDAIIICVPTPLHRDQTPDLSFIIDTARALRPYRRQGQVFVLESTTYPGTTDEQLYPILAEAAADIGTEWVVGEDWFLVYSPEREDPGNPDFNTQSIAKIIGGYTEACLAVGLALYQHAIDHLVPVRSTRVAEMAKLLENIYRAVNIGMINEMKMVAEALEINIYEVIAAARTKPFGFTPFYPGPGLGGHCLPIDPFYLSWKAQQCGVDSRFIRLAGEVNTAMPQWVVAHVYATLAAHGKTPSTARVLVLGVAYKKNIDDMRETPAAEIMQQLRAQATEIAYCDPYVPTFPRMRHYDFELESLAVTADNLARFDLALLVTDHDCFDYELIKTHALLIVDTRGRYADSRAPHIIAA